MLKMESIIGHVFVIHTPEMIISVIDKLRKYDGMFGDISFI